MRLPQRGPDRPPPAVAGPSTRPAVDRLSAPASPEDSRLRSDGVGRGAGRWWFLPDHDGLATSGWCADPRLLPGGEARSYASACAGARLAGGVLAGRLLC